MPLAWEDIIWEPGRYSCRFCSTRRGGEVPAAYDVWYELVENDEDDWAPQCVLLPLCVECTAEERAAPDDRCMRLIRARSCT